MKTIKVKLKPTKFQAIELTRMSKEYINQANVLVQKAILDNSFPKVTSKHIDSLLPSAVKNEVIRYAKSKYKQYGNCIFKKPTVSWNNQNFSINDNSIAFPIIIDGKCKKVNVKAILTEDILNELRTLKLGSLRITKKGFKWIAQISVTTEEVECVGIDTLGIDLGVLVPAVGVIKSTGKTKFFGNGRYNKHLRRKYKALRKKLGKSKKLNAIKNISDKESRIIQDINHKISKSIVDFAVINNCGFINLENLSGIRQTSKIRRENNLHTWTFYQLASFIEYKALKFGIKVNYIDPKFTSQVCPICTLKNKTKTREYSCSCGYKGHRDRVGAINIAKAAI